MCTYTKLTSFALLFALSLSLYAQSGPAGVGNSTGAENQPHNVVWLDASDLSSFGPGDIWNDKSGNGHDAVNSGASISLGTLGGQNALDFSSFNSGNLSIANDSEFDDLTALSTFVVFNTGNGAGPQGLVSKRDNTGDATFTLFLWNNLELNADYSTSGNRISGGVNIPATSYIGNYIFQINDSSKIYKNGVLDGSAFRISDSKPINNTSAAIEIGKLDENYSTYFKGQIAEIIIYKNNLSEIHRALVLSYLSQKYGIAVNDVQIAYNPSDDAFWQDVAGVVQKNSSVRDFGSSAGLYSSLPGASAGDYVMVGHNGDDNNEASIDIGAAVTSSGAEAAWNRAWYVQKNGTSSVRLSFDLSEGFDGGLYPQEIANYVLLRKDNSAGNYSQIVVLDKGVEDGDKIWFEVSDADFSAGYFTLGSTDQQLSPVQGSGSRIWYSLKSTGAWNDPQTWTLAPCGCIPDNPANLTPLTSPTAASDKVVILSGKKVTVPSGVNGIQNESLTVHGELDLGTTSGHGFSTISGTGIISMADDNFPSGDATDFVTEGEGEGTVEFYGNGYNLSTDREFYDVDIVLDNATSELNVLDDFRVNGVLSIQKGTLEIGDDMSPEAVNITIHGDLIVHATANIRTGTANARHSLNLYGDFTNEGGNVAFTNQTVPDYSNEATDGIVDVKILNTEDDQIVTCNGATRFYRLVFDKGSRARTISVNASAPEYFELFGPASHQNTETQNRNALALVSGTLKIGPNVNIEVLNTAGNYHIYENAALWVDGGTVRKNTGNALVPYGELRISSGLVETLVGSGITTRLNGIVRVEGGVLNTNQIRTSVMGAEHNGSYIQSGGTVNVLGGNTTNDYYVFNLTHEDNSFEMSGGTLNIREANGKGGVFINAAPENINVTGGSVFCNIGNDRDFLITSRAPFYNLYLTNSSGNDRAFILSDGLDVGSTDINLEAQPLVVQNNLSIGQNCLLDHNGQNVTVGRNMSIDANATAGPGGTPQYRGYLYDANKPNTTSFSGNSNSSLYIGHNVDDGYEQNFWNVTIEKPAGRKVTLTGDNAKRADQVGAPWRARLMKVNNEFNVNAGVFDQGMYSIRLFGPVNIQKDGVCGVYEHGTTHPDALIMLKDDQVEINTESGAEIGNLKLNPVPNETIVNFNSDVYVGRIAYYNGRINIGSHNLKVDYLHRNGTLNAYPVSDGSVNQMIITNGMASDGGLSLYIPANAEGDSFAFPLGVGLSGTEPGSKYTYGRVRLRSNSDDGYITINPVDKELQTANLSAGDVLAYYWRVRYEGFDQLPQVEYLFKYYDEDVSGNSNSYRPGSVLAVNPFTRSFEDDNSKVDEGTNTILFNGDGTGFDLSESHYTAGDRNCFTGAPLVYYTRDVTREPRWTWGNAWTRSDMLNDIDGNGSVDEDEYHDSRQPAANSYPGSGDIAVIGWVPWGNTQSSGEEGEPHGMWVDNNTQSCAELIFSQMKDAAGNPVPRVYRSNFQFRPTLCINRNGQLNAGMVRGEGMFWNRWSDPDFSLMDIGDFAQNDSSYIVYENDVDAGIVYAHAPDIAPNLLIANEYWGAADWNVTFPNDIETTGNFEILGNLNLLLSDGAAGDITVGRDLLLFETNASSEGGGSGGGASIQFPNSVVRNIIIGRDLILENRGAHIFVNNPDASFNEHTISVGRHIIQESAGGATNGLQFFTGAGMDCITLNLSGADNMSYSYVDGDIPNLYRLVVDKGSSINSRAQFDGDFNLLGATSGGGISKALEIKNGLFILNHPDADIDLSTGDDFFEINNHSGLEVRDGTFYINGGSGLSLDGLLRISGGVLDMSGGDHPVVYSASGNARIEVSGGSLSVGSQVRRAEANNMGVLQYSQRGGNVYIGTDAGGIESRGMFEVLNPGSEFRHTGGGFEILRQNGVNPQSPALYLDPEIAVVSGSKIFLFNGSTPAGQNAFGVRSAIALNDIEINGTNTPRVLLQIESLSVKGNLTINPGATLDANGLDIRMEGNWINGGNYVSAGNEVFFSGTSDQQIEGATSFYKLTKEGEGVLSLASGTDINISYLLTHNSGVIDDNGNNIFAEKDVINNAEFVSGTTGNGLVLNGTVEQKIIGEGTFEKLWLENSAGFSQESGDIIIIKENLQLEEGVFNIGNNEIVFAEGAGITNSMDQFSATNMIQTNASFGDGGIRKYLSPGITDFVFPVGSQGIYTPVELQVFGNSASDGYIRIKASDEVHPSIVDDPSTTMVEPENVLQFYWVVDAGNLTDFSGDLVMSYPPSLVKVSESGYAYDDYITARILSRGSGEWNKNIGVVDVTDHKLTFNFSSATDSEGLSGDYTAGIDEAIPNQVPVYTSVKDGDWTDVSIWTPAPPSGGPKGAIVEIRHDVTIPVNYVVSYKTHIDGSTNGRLLIPGTEGHRLGIVDGTGTLYVETAGVPAGEYSTFFDQGGGTIEFGGIGVSYPVLGGIYNVNNLKFSGSGTREFPNAPVNVKGDLIIDGASSLMVDNRYDKAINVGGNITFNSGNFDAGEGAGAVVELNGQEPQGIMGSVSFTGNNAFYNLKMNNPDGAVFSSPVEVTNLLTLEKGRISTNSGTLTLTNPSENAVVGGSSNSYVEGPMVKYINHNSSFVYPVGHTGRYGEIHISNTNTAGVSPWEAEYFNVNPASNGLDPESFNYPVAFVSRNEYWRVKGPSGGEGSVTIRWDNQSGISLDPQERDDLRMVEWQDQSPDDLWTSTGSVLYDGGQNTGTLRTDSRDAFNEFGDGNFYTIGAMSISNYPWLGYSADWFDTGNWQSGNIPSANTEVEIPAAAEVDFMPEIDGDAFCMDLTIEENGVVTLLAGATLNITNDLTNNGEIVLKSTPDAVSALNVPVDNADSGTGSIELPVKANQWYRFGQPFVSPTGLMYDAGNATSWVYRSTTNWQRITSNTASIHPMEGIMALYESDQILSFTGELNTGPKHWEIPYGRGYYLFANPYPSSIKWDIDDVEDTGVSISDNLSATIYYRVYAGSQVGDYMITYNGFTGLSVIEDGESYPGGYTSQNIGTISPLQSVWVLVEDANNATIDLSNKARVSDNSLPLKSASSQDDRQVIRMVQSNEFISDVAVIYFDEAFDAGLERSDSEKMFNSSKKVPEIYTRFGDKNLCMNGLPALGTDGASIPLSVKNQMEGTVEISASLDEFSDQYDVILEDTETGIFTDLRQENSYSYTAEPGTVHDRFVLHIEPVSEVPTNIFDGDRGQSEKILISGHNEFALVQIPEKLLREGGAEIKLMNMSGRQINQLDDVRATETRLQLPENSGVYIISVQVNDQNVSAKVVRP